MDNFSWICFAFSLFFLWCFTFFTIDFYDEFFWRLFSQWIGIRNVKFTSFFVFLEPEHWKISQFYFVDDELSIRDTKSILCAFSVCSDRNMIYWCSFFMCVVCDSSSCPSTICWCNQNEIINNVKNMMCCGYVFLRHIHINALMSFVWSVYANSRTQTVMITNIGRRKREWNIDNLWFLLVSWWCNRSNFELR